MVGNGGVRWLVVVGGGNRWPDMVVTLYNRTGVVLEALIGCYGSSLSTPLFSFFCFLLQLLLLLRLLSSSAAAPLPSQWPGVLMLPSSMGLLLLTSSAHPSLSGPLVTSLLHPHSSC